MPGHSIAAVRELKSSLWATAGGKGAETRPKRFSQALIAGKFKIIFGQQQGRGIFFGPVFPNGTKDQPAYPCVDGCLYAIAQPSHTTCVGNAFEKASIHPVLVRKSSAEVLSLGTGQSQLQNS